LLPHSSSYSPSLSPCCSLLFSPAVTLCLFPCLSHCFFQSLSLVVSLRSSLLVVSFTHCLSHSLSRAPPHGVARGHEGSRGVARGREGSRGVREARDPLGVARSPGGSRGAWGCERSRRGRLSTPLLRGGALRPLSQPPLPRTLATHSRNPSQPLAPPGGVATATPSRPPPPSQLPGGSRVAPSLWDL
jgi:hypothetical protein